MRSLIVTLISSLALFGCADTGQPRLTTDPAAASAELNTLFDEWFELQLERNPIRATAIGDLRYNDRLPNFLAAAYREEERGINRRYLARARAIPRDALAGQDRLGWDIFVRDRELAIEAERFPGWMLPVNQIGSHGSFFAQLGSGRSIQPFREVKHYDDFLARIARFPELNATAIENMRAGIAAGVVQPRAVVEKTIPQFAAHVVDDPERSVFWGAVAAMPDDFPDAERERLVAAYRAAIMDTLVPEYLAMQRFLEDEYLPAARDEVGMLHLPDGRAWYAFQVKGQTTTDLTPEEIHAFGLAEVARILGEMNAVRERVGFAGDLQAFFRHLQDDDRFYYDDEEALLQGYRDLQAKINPLLPRLFDVFPRADYEVRAVEPFRARSAPGASYMAPAPDGTRPGVFYVNTYNLRAQPKFGMETLSIHEASPGHHFQISIQQEIESLPMFRRFGGYSAYSEGWALYAESLGRELGVFTDPYQWYGRLADEQLRAMRLVVDTGMHHYGWTRERAIAYMTENSSMADTDVVAEVERYIVWPGQALNYKVGERVIRELRNEAAAALGDDFDVRAFHRQVLTDGALPLGVLQLKIREWIAASSPTRR